MIEFKRTPATDWEEWPETNIPQPPAALDAPFPACYHDHHGHCRDWRGVHFVAIRIDGREFRGGHPISCLTK